jgi:hypothetical protein
MRGNDSLYYALWAVVHDLIFVMSGTDVPSSLTSVDDFSRGNMQEINTAV